MYWDEHVPPHFHALYGEYEGLIDIRKLVVMTGRLPRRAESLVLEWAAQHQQELLEDWDLCQNMHSPRKISPLE